jgi:uncharacterized protein YbjT (DUF2867 family)
MSKPIIAIMGATGAQGGGLARAIAADPGGPFSARAITRHPDSDKAQALKALGVEVVAGDADDPESLDAAFAGAHGLYCVTNYWEHLNVDREGAQASAMARVAGKAGVGHVIWSTLEDTRLRIPLTDKRMPVLYNKYFVPHFDSKGQVDHAFENEGVPTSFLYAAFYWDNFIHFGMGPRKGDDSKYVLALPLGGAKLPGIWSGDIGRCAYGIFKRGASAVDQKFGVAGETLSGPEIAAKMGSALGRDIAFADVPFDVYRGLGFPGAEDLGNMFQYQQILGEEFYAARSSVVARELNPGLLDFDAWLSANKDKIAV